MSGEKDYFRVFCKISRAFATTRDKARLLDLIVKSAVETMDGKAASLFLKDGKEDVFVPVCQTGLSDDYLHADPYRGKALADEMLKKGYMAFKDVSTDGRIENKQAKKTEGIASILAVPVIAEGAAIGVLSLYTSEIRDFSDQEIEFLKALAEHGGIAILNARLVERLTQNATLFHDMADNINSANFDIKKIFHILTADIAETFGIKGVCISLLNKDSDTLDLVASYGLSEEFINKGPIHKDKSIASALSGETVIIKDAPSDKRIQYRKEVEKEGIVSVLCVPIQSGDEIIGVMRLFSDEEMDFPEDVIILVEALAHQGGIAIQNASMYLSLQEDKKSLEEDVWSHRMWF